MNENKKKFIVNILLESSFGGKTTIVVVEVDDGVITFLNKENEPILSFDLTDLEKAIKILKNIAGKEVCE